MSKIDQVFEMTGAIQTARERHFTAPSPETDAAVRQAELAYRDLLTRLNGLEA